MTLPKPGANYLKRSFSYSGATLWNNLPNSLKKYRSVAQFKRHLKKISDTEFPHGNHVRQIQIVLVFNL